MIFFEVQSISEIEALIHNNLADTNAEIINFSHSNLAIPLMDRLKHINHFAFHNVGGEDNLGRFIDALAVRLSNADDPQIMTIHLGEQESKYLEDVNKIFKSYGVKPHLFLITTDSPQQTNENHVISDDTPKKALRDEGASIQQTTELCDIANRSVFQRALGSPAIVSPSARLSAVLKNETQETEMSVLSSVSDENIPALLPGVTNSNLDELRERLDQINRDTFNAAERLNRFQASAPTARKRLSFSEAASACSPQVSHQNNLSTSYGTLFSTTLAQQPAAAASSTAVQDKNDQLTQNWVVVPQPVTTFFTDKKPQMTPEQAKKWWEEQKAKPLPELPPDSRLRKVLEKMQDEDRKAQRLPPINRSHKP